MDIETRKWLFAVAAAALICIAVALATTELVMNLPQLSGFVVVSVGGALSCLIKSRTPN